MAENSQTPQLIQFSKRKCVNVDSNSFDSLVECVPNGCGRILFSNLTVVDNFEYKYILGKIVQIWPIRKRPKNGYLRKLLITDTADVESVNNLTVFLFDKYANESDGAEKEDYIIISDFVVENLTHFSQRTQGDAIFPFQILVQHDVENHPNRNVWICRTVANDSKGSPIKTLVSKRTVRTDSMEQPSTSSASAKKLQGTVSKSPTHYNLRRRTQSRNSQQTSPNVRQKSQESNAEELTPSNSRRRTQETEQTSPSVRQLPVYQYATLNELSASSEETDEFNVYGIVDDCQLRTNPSSHIQSLELLLSDSTRSELRCMIYTSRKDEGPFPDIHPGDIIRIHRLKVSCVRSQLRGTCISHKFIVVFTKEDGVSNPKTTAKSFTFTDIDKEKVKDLFKWMEEQNAPKLICDINLSEDVSVISQVISVYVCKAKECIVIKIWDGTKNEDFLSEHLGLTGEQIDKELLAIAESYYINLFVFGNYCFTAGELKPSQYVIVRHASVTRRSPSSRLKLIIPQQRKENRGVYLLQDDDPQLQDLKIRLDKVREEVQEITAKESNSDTVTSFFLNCDISIPMNKPPHNGKLPSESNRRESIKENEIVSITRAAVLPGQSTQGFGGIYEEMNKKTNLADRHSHEREMVEENTTEQQNTLGHNDVVAVQNNQQTSNNQDQWSQPLNTESLSGSLINASQDMWWKSLTDNVSVTDGHANIPPMSVSEIMQKTPPYKFHVIASVLNFKPETRTIDKLIRLYCSLCHFLSKSALISEILEMLEVSRVENELPLFFCPNCKTSERDKCPLLEYSFLIDFMLHDGSVEMIEAYLWRENAVKFFKGITPEEALLNKPVANSIFEMLWKICPNCRPKEVVADANYFYYPILDCCLKSYNAGDSVRYQIFDTIVI